MTMNAVFESFAAAPDGRAAAIPDLEYGELTAAEQSLFDQLDTVAKPGSRIPYIDFVKQPVLPMQEGCKTQGKDIWDEESGKDGRWRMGISMSPTSLKCMAIAEAVAKLKVGSQHPDNTAAQQLLTKDESNISTEYNRITCSTYGKKADGQLHFATKNQKVFWKLDEDCTQPIPEKEWDNARLDTLGHGNWFPSCVHTKLPTGKYDTQGSWYDCMACLKLGIAQGGKLSWNLSMIVFEGESASGGGKAFEPAIPLSTMADAKWTCGTDIIKGKRHSNTYVSLMHSASTNPKWPSNVLFSQYDEAMEPVPFDVGQLFISKENPDTDATVVLSSSTDPHMTNVSKMMANIEAEIETNLKALGKTWRPNKKKPELTWKSATEFYTPRILQTAENKEKYGEREGLWLKLPYHFDRDDNKTADPVTTYLTTPTWVASHEALSRDPEDLVKEGQLKRCEPGLHFGKNAKLFAVARVSKVNTTPKFSYGFQPEYLIVTDVGEHEGATSSAVLLANGSTLNTDSLDSFADNMARLRGAKRQKRDDSEEVAQNSDSEHGEEEEEDGMDSD